MEPKWTKQPAHQGTIHQGCLNCPTPKQTADMSQVIAVGFGIAQVTRDSFRVYSEMDCGDEDDLWTFADAERAAMKDPDYDWQVQLVGPLHSETYQRHGVGEWVIIQSDMGFA